MAPTTDWRDYAAYTWLLSCERSRFAWEWVRRNDAYRRAWRENDARAAAAIGLSRLENPDLALDARPIWSRALSPAVLLADAAPAADDDHFALTRVAPLATMHRSHTGEHWLFSDGVRDVRLDIATGSLERGPVDLRWRLGIAHLDRHLETLCIFSHLAVTGQMPNARPEQRAARWIAALRVSDALAAGATQREIAEIFFSRYVSGPRWRITAPEMRLRVQRLVSTARRMEGGAWRQFLTAM